MNLFGFDINIKKQGRGNRNTEIPQYVWNYMYGREHVKSTDETSLLNAYKSWVYVCSSRNAATFASTPLQLFVTKTSNTQKIYAPTRQLKSKKKDYLFSRYSDLPCLKKAVDIEEITEHPFIDLTNNVNEFMNKTDCLEISDLHEELTGNAYWYLRYNNLEVPSEIWILQPDKVWIVPDKQNFISHYMYKLGYGMDALRIEKEDIIHFKFPNPKDPYYGASPLQAVAEMYNINQNMNTYENAMFTNNARMEGYFSTDEEITDTSWERLKTELKETWEGVTNTGKTGLLDQGIKFNQISFSPRELGFLNGRRWSKSEIFEAYDTPMGLLDEKANRANAEAAQYVYMKFGIQPRHKRFEEKLNEKLLPLYDEKLFVAFENCVPDDKEFNLKEEVDLVGAGIKTRNEIRLNRGEEPISGGDTIFIPMGSVPLSIASAGGGYTGEDQEVEEAIDDIAEKIYTKLTETGK